ncbi:hypothetical protein DL93DRAFT_1999047 [Clavulina sp. PMI_390]|nr:hypothetical protein DL93DRAFT_1999047 [Clavulina sp. PMI_390]
MFWRIWKHPRAIHYSGTAVDEEDTVQVKPNSMTSRQYVPTPSGGFKMKMRSMSRFLWRPSESDLTVDEGDGMGLIENNRLSHTTHPSISVTEPSDDGHQRRWLDEQAILDASPPLPPQIPQATGSAMSYRSSSGPTEVSFSSGSGVSKARKAPPSIMPQDLESDSPGIRAPVPVRAEQPPMPQLAASPPPSSVGMSAAQSSSTTPFVIPPPPPPLSVTGPASPRSSAAYSSPPRQVYNPYRDPQFATFSPNYQAATLSQPQLQSPGSQTQSDRPITVFSVSTLPDPIGPPPAPPILDAPYVPKTNAERPPTTYSLASVPDPIGPPPLPPILVPPTAPGSSTSATSSPTSPTGRGPRAVPRGARSPGAKRRSQVVSILSTATMGSDDTDGRAMMGMTGPRPISGLRS